MRVSRWGPWAVYLALWAGLVRFFWFKLNPDTLAYFSLAHHYLRGEWLEAINTGWSPAISWLMLPLVGLGLSDIAAIRLLGIGSGLLALYAVGQLAEDFELGGTWRWAAEYTAAGMVAMYTLLFQGPDLLEAALLLLYLRPVLREDYAKSGRGWVAGAWGAAAFLTKGYALYFFLGHFALVHLWQAWQRSAYRGRLLRQWASGMAVFLALSAPWFGAMAYKAGKLTTGTTGAWNYRLVGPDSVGYPQYFGLIPPAGEHGSSMWDEPQPDLLPAWSVLGSARELKHQLKLVYYNVRMLAMLALYASILSVAAILAYAAWGLGRLETARLSWVLVCATLLIYPTGYLLILVVDRYLWAMFLLLLLLGAAVAQAGARNLKRAGAVLLGAGYFLSFLMVPARMLLAQANTTPWADTGRQIEAARPGISGRLASCGNWNDSVQIAWMLHMPFYGVTGATSGEFEVATILNPDAVNLPFPEPPGDAELAEQMKQYRIDYLLVLPDCPRLPEGLPLQEVWQEGGSRLLQFHW